MSITLCYSSKGQINILVYTNYMYVIYPRSVELDTKGLLDPKHYQFSKTCVLFDFKVYLEGDSLGCFYTSTTVGSLCE